VELSSTEQIKHCLTGISSHPLLEIDWNCAGPRVDELDEITLEQIGARRFNINLDVPTAEEVKLTSETKNFDYLLLDRVLSKKADPVQYLRNCAQLLRDDGFVIVSEVTGDYEISLFIDALQGVELNSRDVSSPISRIYGIYFNKATLEKVRVNFTSSPILLRGSCTLQIFEEAGFRVVMHQTDESMSTAIFLIKRISSVARKPAILDIGDVKEFNWIKPLQKVIEERLNEPDHKSAWFYSSKVRNNGALGAALCRV